MLSRCFWLVIFTFEISVNCYNMGGAVYQSIPYFSKWGLWMTYICYIIGLFSTYPPKDDAKSLTSYNSPFCAWKWYIMLFELSLVIGIFNFFSYWTILHNDMWNDESVKKGFAGRFGLVTDHILPQIALILEWFMTNPPLVKRHVVVLIAITTLYLIINLSYSLAYRSPYNFMSWHSFGGTMLHLLGLLIVVVEFFLFEWCNRKKIAKFSDSSNNQILEILDR